MITIKELYKITTNLRLLYIEDDVKLKNQMHGVFSELFKSVDTAANGEEGLSLFNEHLNKMGFAYDIVITDINMPKMNGIQLIKSIYKTHPLQAIVVVSAHNESDYLLELLDLGINSFLIKPVSHNALVSTLYKVVSFLVNEKRLEEHYKNVEELNDRLSETSKNLEISNDALVSKNIALEKSMRIIEGLQHKDQVQKKLSFPINSSNFHVQSKDETTEDNKFLSDIEKHISNIALDCPNKKIQDISLLKLSQAILAYAHSLSSEKKSYILVDSLSKLASDIKKKPTWNSKQNFERIINMLESFFFIYAKWERQWEHIQEKDFTIFCASIESEINTLREVYNEKE